MASLALKQVSKDAKSGSCDAAASWTYPTIAGSRSDAQGKEEVVALVVVTQLQRLRS